MTQGPFDQRKVTWIVTISTASLTAGLLLIALSPDLESTTSRQADSFSRSAIGHHALVEILRELDIPVLVSRHATSRRAGTSLLMLLEPPEVSEGERPPPPSAAAQPRRLFSVGDRVRFRDTSENMATLLMDTPPIRINLVFLPKLLGIFTLCKNTW